jgi:hypothetical protein
LDTVPGSRSTRGPTPICDTARLAKYRGQPVEFTWRLFHAVAARLHSRPRVPATALFSGVAVAQRRGSQGMPALGSYSVVVSRCCVICGTDICGIAVPYGRASQPPMVVRIGGPSPGPPAHRRGRPVADPREPPCHPILPQAVLSGAAIRLASRPRPGFANSRPSLPGAGMRLPGGISHIL